MMIEGVFLNVLATTSIQHFVATLIQRFFSISGETFGWE